MIPSVIGKIVWRGKQVLDKVEAQVQQNMDKAAILLQGEIVKSFGSPPVMPEGQLTPYGVRKLASRARKKQEREYRKGMRKMRMQKKRLARAEKQMKRALKRGKW